MPRPDSQILTVSQMQAAEQELVDAGTSVDQLMERAGQGAAEWVWRVAAGRSVTVLCGPGNNGGDGFVIARILRERGLAVRVIAPIGPRTAAARNARAMLGGDIATDGPGLRGGVLVDCLYGSGLSRPLDHAATGLIARLAHAHDYRIALDVPSGIECDSGALLADELPRFELTLALGAWKFAHWSLPAAMHMGHRVLVPIGVARAANAAHLIRPPRLAQPAEDAHKYVRGLVAVVGGAMAGAALLACSAAQAAGAGYVRLLAGRDDFTVPPDLVMDRSPLGKALADRRINAVLVGPGLGRDDAALTALRRSIASAQPLVLDADALHLLVPEMLADAGMVVATPHEGELAVLYQTFGIGDGEREVRLKALARRSGMVIVAKGPYTRVVSPEGQIAIAGPAPSWLSTAGTGDVLAGILASRLAGGGAAFDAACEAVWLHGEAARRAGAAFTASGLAAHVSAAYAACL